MSETKVVTISADQYEQLLEDSMWLSALRAAGVANWDGYNYAIKLFMSLRGERDE